MKVRKRKMKRAKKLKPNQIWNRYICPAIEISVEVFITLATIAAVVAFVWVLGC